MRDRISVEYFEQKQGGEKTILVSVTVHILEDLDAEEFRLLAKSAGAEILEHVHRSKNSNPILNFFIGSGKAEEIAARVQELEATLVIIRPCPTPLLKNVI